MLRTGPFGNTLRSATAWACVALVTWQAAASALELRRELGKPWALHVRALRASPEELVRAKLGEDYDIWVALREHLPRDARVMVSFPAEDVREASRRRKDVRNRIVKLSSLLYPQTLEGWKYDPVTSADDHLGPTPRQEYVLELESGRDYSVWPLCEELARGPGFRLLLLGNRPR